MGSELSSAWFKQGGGLIMAQVAGVCSSWLGWLGCPNQGLATSLAEGFVIRGEVAGVS